MKLSTDMDFRHFKRREMIEGVTALAQLAKAGVSKRSMMTADAFIEELATMFNIDPRKMWKREGFIEAETNRRMMDPRMQQDAMRGMVSQSPRASEMMRTGIMPQ